MDFSDVLAGLSVSPGVTAIIGAGAIMAAPYFARWLTTKVSTFFDGDDTNEDDDEDDDFLEEGGIYECEECGYQMDYDGALNHVANGYCAKCGE